MKYFPTLLGLLSLAMLCISCDKPNIDNISSINDTLAYVNKTGRYFSESELDTMIGKCNTLTDIEYIFGKPIGVYSNYSGGETWSYYAPPSLYVIDGIAGFSVVSGKNGAILKWNPILDSSGIKKKKGIAPID